MASARPWSESDTSTGKKQKDKPVTLGEILQMILEEFYGDAGLFCAPDGAVSRTREHRITGRRGRFSPEDFARG